MTNEEIMTSMEKKYTELFCPEGVTPTGGEQLKKGNSYPNAGNIDLKKHLAGNKTIALDLIYKDDTGHEFCKVGVFDIDQLDAEGLAMAIKIRDYLKARGITALSAFSGNKGYHVYMVSEPIPKDAMCKILKKVKAKFPFKGELIPVDVMRCKIAPCVHQVAGNWSYLFENEPHDSLIKLK